VPVAWPFMLMACYFGPSYYTLPHSVLLPKISRVGANLTATPLMALPASLAGGVSQGMVSSLVAPVCLTVPEKSQTISTIKVPYMPLVIICVLWLSLAG
jgi:hypothetical protein